MPLSPIKNNETDEGYDEPVKRKGRNQAKKNLFGGTASENIKIDTPKKSRSKTNADFAKIKAKLSLENPGIILGREKEQGNLKSSWILVHYFLGEVEDFIMSSIREEQSGSMYISGQPGTGKSASINNILDSIQPNLEDLQARSGKPCLAQHVWNNG